jgi:pyrroline-5-carboxylate reductase
VFYFLEHLVRGAVANGLSQAQAKALALQTFKGATHLAASSTEPLSTLRERVTSKGGTTHAALEHMRAAGVGDALEKAVAAATVRAKELGEQFG